MIVDEMTKLTAQVKAGGCASKLSPGLLDRALRTLPRVPHHNVLVGFDTADDAGVYQLTPDLAIVQTVDFFTAMVDDPATFGAIAAANALSDVYAMGGVPVSALSVVAFPAEQDIDILSAIMRGGAEKMHEAGCAVLGGHSVNDPEIKFGFAVTGTIHPQRIKTNTGAQPGDVLMFTKALGTGAITTALKRGFAQQEHVACAIDSMLRLNRDACEAMLRHTVNACTDVSGFGMIGHAREMALGSGVTLQIEAAGIPVLPGALEAIGAGAVPGGAKNNREFASCVVEVLGDVPGNLIALLYDPQTSGGLLISMPPDSAEAMARDYPQAKRIGRVLARDNKPIRLI